MQRIIINISPAAVSILPPDDGGDDSLVPPAPPGPTEPKGWSGIDLSEAAMAGFSVAAPGAPGGSRIFKLVEDLIARLRDRGADESTILAAVKQFIHGPTAALIVRLTPNKIDDAALEMLKLAFPL